MKNIHPEFTRFLSKLEKEKLLGQVGAVYWMYGLSGAGKSTLANATERVLHEEGRMTTILDGDNMRSGLNANLGFTDKDRLENVRRTAEVAKIFASQGIQTFVSVITPAVAYRDLARKIIGSGFHEVYIHASYETTERRDVKGLYLKAAKGEIKNFTGKDSLFEVPDMPELVLDTEKFCIGDCVQRFIQYIRSNQTK